MVYRIGDNAKYNTLNMLIMNSQARMSALQIQASSGRAGETYADIASGSGQALRLENSYIRYKRYQDNIAAANLRLDDLESAVSGIQDLATKFRTLMTGAASTGNYDAGNTSAQVTDMMQQLQALLNKQSGGQYIFSGTLTDTRPVDISRWGAPMPVPTNYNAPAAYTVPAFPATPTNFPVTIAANTTSDYFGYFTANTQSATVRADDNLNISYGLTAADPAFAKLFYAMQVAATAGSAPAAEQKDRINGALSIMDGVVNSLANMRSSIGSKGNLLDATSKKHGDYLSKVEGLVNDIESADVTSVMAKLSAEQTQLQASYMTISKINEVSLVNYLR